jgi:MFS family permease
MQDALNIDAQKALMGLTVHMAALTLMRLALGRLLKIYKNTTILNCCYALIIAGGLLFWLGNSFELLLIALMLFGAGFAGVFPIFLGLVGNKFAHLSATAFSVIFVIALLGNMILNYGMGLLSFHYGVKQLPLLLLFASICMGILFLGTKKYFTSADG